MFVVRDALLCNLLSVQIVWHPAWATRTSNYSTVALHCTHCDCLLSDSITIVAMNWYPIDPPHIFGNVRVMRPNNEMINRAAQITILQMHSTAVCLY